MVNWIRTCVALLWLATGSVGAQSLQPMGTPDGPKFVKGASKRYGNAVTFTVIKRFGVSVLPGYFAVTHLAHCTKGWISQAIAVAGSSTAVTTEAALQELQSELNNPDASTGPVDFLITPSASERRAAQLAQAQCKAPIAIGGRDEWAIAETGRGPEPKRIAKVYGIVLRTVIVKGDTVEAWLKSRSVESEVVMGIDGAPAKRDDGTPYTQRILSPKSPFGMTKVIARCAKRTLAEVANIDYGADGGVIQSRTTEPKDFRFDAPIPDSLGEKWLTVLCEMA